MLVCVSALKFTLFRTLKTIQGSNVHVWKESGVTTKGKGEVEVAILLLNNDENNVTAKNVLSYLQCLSSKFEL